MDIWVISIFFAILNIVATNFCVPVSLDSFHTRQKYISDYLTHCYLDFFFCLSQLIIFLEAIWDLEISILKDRISSLSILSGSREY